MGKNDRGSAVAETATPAPLPSTQIRWTLFWVMIISMSLIGVLAAIYSKEYVALVGSASSLIGGLGSVLKQLISPDKDPPDPAIDEGTLTPRGYERVLRSMFAPIEELPVTVALNRVVPPQLRKNLLIVLFFGSVFIIVLSQIFPITAAIAIIALANALIGYGVGSMLQIVTPSKPDPDPVEDEGWATPRGYERINNSARKYLGLQRRVTEPGTGDGTS